MKGWEVSDVTGWVCLKKWDIDSKFMAISIGDMMINDGNLELIFRRSKCENRSFDVKRAFLLPMIILIVT
jgi:hypothetical protein